MKKIIIEIDEDFCPNCFKQINMYLGAIQFKMTHMKRVEGMEVYKWIQKD